VSEAEIKQAIKNKTMHCPQCEKPITDYDKYTLMTVDVWDGPGDSRLGTGGDKVTLICGNEGCNWKERTEYWRNFLNEES
jgi:hypothetical protein